MKNYFLDLFRGAISLLDGLLVTLQALFSRPVTEQYPRRMAELSPNFRGCLSLVLDEEHKLLCTACGLCSRTCPSGCLTVKGMLGKFKKPASYTYDISRCSFCGLCVSTCPFNALAFKPVRTRVATDRRNFQLELCPGAEEPTGP